MKKLFALLLALVLLAVPVAAEGYFIMDDSGLLQDHDVEKLEQVYRDYSVNYGFTPVLVTTDSFGGISAEEFAGQYYDLQGYPQDGILLLVSLEEGEWYILTNGECYNRIADEEALAIGEELVPLIQDGSYYAAFLKFPQLAAEIYDANEPVFEEEEFYEEPEFVEAEPERSNGKTIFICMLVGMLIGGITVGVMAWQMKSVRQQSGAADYIRPGSMHLTNSRDIFLYSHVSRTPKPKSNSSSGGGGGGSRGGAGGRL